MFITLLVFTNHTLMCYDYNPYSNKLGSLSGSVCSSRFSDSYRSLCYRFWTAI